jgi:hypothetical protein
MSNRLKFFRRLMSAFEGTSNPQRAVERGFYVNLPNNPIEEITGRVALRPSSVHLLFGGIGSGKTTQLLLTQQALNDLEDIKAIYVDVSLVTDISDLQPGALITIAGLELINILGNSTNLDLENPKKIIKEAAYGYTEYISPKAIGLRFGEQKINRKGLISTENRENRESISLAFSALSKAAVSITKKEIIFLFDGLDRLSKSQTFINSALDDVIEINKTGVGSILVGSTVIPYIERAYIAGITGYSYFLPYLDALENAKAQQFFTEIFKVRDPENFIAPDARELLIFDSGGVLRDLMSLCQASIEEAYMDGSDQITKQHSIQASEPMIRSKLIGLTDSSIDTLRKVMTEKSFSPRTAEDFELMLTGHILEYRYPRQRFVVHPILAPIIKNMVASVANG